MDMMVTRHSTARAFLATAESFLQQAEVENNLIPGITRDIVADPSGLMERTYFATVAGDAGVCMGGLPVGARQVAITPAHDADAVAALCRDVHKACPEVDAVIGPDATVGDFSRGFAALRGLRAETRMRQRTHELRTVSCLSGLPTGTFRPGAPLPPGRVP